MELIQYSINIAVPKQIAFVTFHSTNMRNSQPLNHCSKYFSVPEPVQSVALVADSETTTGLTLTIVPTSVSGANEDSDITVVPTCNGGSAEARQQPTCDPTTNHCSVTGLTVAGCRYTFDVQMECDTSDAVAVYSTTETTGTLCTS